MLGKISICMAIVLVVQCHPTTITSTNADLNTTSPTSTNEDIGQMFEHYENQYIKNGKWTNDEDALRNAQEKQILSSSSSSATVAPLGEPLNDISENFTEPITTTNEEIVDNVHSIVDEMSTPEDERNDRTIVVVVNTNFYTLNSKENQEQEKQQHRELSFGNSAFLLDKSNDDSSTPTMNLHNKITNDFFNDQLHGNIQHNFQKSKNLMNSEPINSIEDGSLLSRKVNLGTGSYSNNNILEKQIEQEYTQDSAILEPLAKILDTDVRNEFTKDIPVISQQHNSDVIDSVHFTPLQDNREYAVEGAVEQLKNHVDKSESADSSAMVNLIHQRFKSSSVEKQQNTKLVRNKRHRHQFHSRDEKIPIWDYFEEKTEDNLALFEIYNDHIYDYLGRELGGIVVRNPRFNTLVRSRKRHLNMYRDKIPADLREYIERATYYGCPAEQCARIPGQLLTCNRTTDRIRLDMVLFTDRFRLQSLNLIKMDDNSTDLLDDISAIIVNPGPTKHKTEMKELEEIPEISAIDAELSKNHPHQEQELLLKNKQAKSHAVGKKLKMIFETNKPRNNYTEFELDDITFAAYYNALFKVYKLKRIPFYIDETQPLKPCMPIPYNVEV